MTSTSAEAEARSSIRNRLSQQFEELIAQVLVPTTVLKTVGVLVAEVDAMQRVVEATRNYLELIALTQSDLDPGINVTDVMRMQCRAEDWVIDALKALDRLRMEREP